MQIERIGKFNFVYKDNEGPNCPLCYDDEGKFIMLQEAMEGESWECRKCRECYGPKTATTIRYDMGDGW